MKFLYIVFRMFAAVSLSWVIIMLVTFVGKSAGEALGLESNRNAGEVASGFLAGALIVLIYRDRLDMEKERRERGR